MEPVESLSRRRVLKYTGIATATALVAGCNDEEDPEDDDDPADDDDPVNGNDNENEDENGDEDEWEDVDEIELMGYTAGWEGVAPDAIDGEENPTLVLYEGQEYDITWENGDGDEHNLEIRDEDGEVVEDYETDFNSEEGETETLEGVEATEEMAAYVCEPHESTMDGEIQIEENGNGDDENDENGDDENGDDENDDE